MATQKDMLDKLRSNCALFREFNDQDMVNLFRLVKPQVFKQSQVIFHKNDPADSVYIVISGAVEVFMPREPDKVITKLGDGQIFGEMGMLYGQTRNASVRAVEETQVFNISEKIFNDNINIGLLAKIYKNLARIVSQRANEMVRVHRDQLSSM
ncbi:MAG: cyclic nucleotide-binding domain-containing protein [Nitrospinae bacterium]|nr:cyclic nucleotide-binding domain-containing protein [Nitrospinota bacterium]